MSEQKETAVTHRVMNFGAGPAGLPKEALERAREELLDFDGTGMSVMEHSHRGEAYARVHAEAEGLLRELAAVPETHCVLFLQGGASQAFATVPMNFLRPGERADYAVTGVWGEKALEEAKRVGQARDVLGLERRFFGIPQRHPDGEGAAYLHITSNNTLEGTQYAQWPESRAPLVADMSSDILSRAVDFGRFALVYAGAQKNLGPSGVTVVIAERDFIAGGREDIPKIFRFETHAEARSLYNTPPTFGIYLLRNVLAWARDEGGVAVLSARNEEKASRVYAEIDVARGFFCSFVELGSRSRMNVLFHLPTPELDKRFVAEAAAEGMVGLKGHRSTGGIRVSLYNAVSITDAMALAQFMKHFAKRYG